MDKDTAISRMCLNLSLKLLPLFIKNEQVLELLDKQNKTASQYRWSVSQLSVVLCIAILTFSMPINMIIFTFLMLLEVKLAAYFVLWISIGFFGTLMVLSSFKVHAIQSFQKKHGIEKALPVRYFYATQDIDLWVAFLGAIATGITAVLIVS